MKRKSAKTVQKGTLVIGEMIEFTDPAEQAELDRRCREAEKAIAGRQAKASERKVT